MERPARGRRASSERRGGAKYIRRSLLHVQQYYFFIKHLMGQRQHAPEDNLTEQIGASFDLAGNVTDDATEIDSERLPGPVSAIELLGVGVALMVISANSPTRA